MKTNLLRCGALCLIVSVLCAGAIFQYMTAEKKQRTNAILVMAYQTRDCH